MKCFKCKRKKGVINVPSLEKKACKQCFARIIEKRFNKAVKSLGLREVSISLEQPSDEVLLYLLKKRAEKDRELRVSVGESTINQATLDDLAVSALKSFKTGKDCVIKEPALLEGISEQELINYSKIKGLRFRGNHRSGLEGELHELLMKLDQRRPGVMYSIKAFIKKLFQ